MLAREAPESGGRDSGLASVTVHKLWGVSGFCFPGGLFFLTLIFCPSSSGVQGGGQGVRVREGHQAKQGSHSAPQSNKKKEVKSVKKERG